MIKLKFAVAILIFLVQSHLCVSAAVNGQLCESGVLRMDYILCGKSGSNPSISLLRTVSQPGRRAYAHGSELPLAGNGRITVTDRTSGDTIYRQSFSTLFQEWMELGDTTMRAFENSFIIPKPKNPVDVELLLCDSRHRVVARHSATVDPYDILIAPATDPAYDTVMIHRGTYTGPKIGVAILAEGYTAEEMDDFVKAAREAVEAILSHEPFRSYADRFDFVAVKSVSKDSGVSVPKDGKWLDTAFGSHFSTFYSDRYLTTPRVFALHDAMSGVDAEHIIVLANTDTYGGGGIYNSYTLTAAGHKQFKPVVVHEFGHSFGGLADEYFYENDVMSETYPLDVEPWEQNVTTLVDFGSKWADMVKKDTPVPTPAGDNAPSVGVFEGAAYSTHGLYRPADKCRMRVNDIDHFCPVCQRAIERLILFYTTPSPAK